MPKGKPSAASSGSCLPLVILSRKIGGPEADATSGFRGAFTHSYRLGGTQNITVEVNNVLVDREIHNVFGVIKGFTDPGSTNWSFLV